MTDNIDEQISELQKQIENNIEIKNRINGIRQEMEEAHLKMIKRLEGYMDCESLTERDRQEYIDKYTEEKESFLAINDEYDELIRKINKENEENEEKCRELKNRSEEENTDTDKKEENH